MNKAEIRKRRRGFTRQFYKGNTGIFVLALSQTIILVGANLMISWLMQKLIDVTTGADPLFTLPQVTCLCAACIAVFAFGMWIAYLTKPQFIAKAIGQYKEYVFQKISQKGISAFAGENTSFYISALSNDANTIEAVSNGVSLLDATVSGMGRGAGNCYMESLLAFLRNPKYNLVPVMDFVQKYIQAERDKGNIWGYDIPYLLTGVMNSHPSSAIRFENNRRVDYSRFYQELLDNME